MDEENSDEKKGEINSSEENKEPVKEPQEPSQPPAQPARESGTSPIRRSEPIKPAMQFSSSNGNVTSKLRKNPFILSTLICGVLAVLLLVLLLSNSGGMTGNVVSENTAADNLVNYLNSIVDGGVEFIGVTDAGALYEVTVEYQGQQIPIYVTKDGSSYTSNLIPITQPTTTQTTTTTEVPKSDVPEVELFIWSYCPYGVQAQAPLAEVAALLGDEANFKAVLYHNGHGAHETEQNKIQECIQKLAPDKYWEYAAKFVTDVYPKCSSGDVGCDLTESTSLMDSLGIDSSAVLDCVESEGDALFEADIARAGELGVTGSPTLVINGVKVNPASRTAEAFKSAVCDAFTEAPEECGSELSSESDAASGNC